MKVSHIKNDYQRAQPLSIGETRWKSTFQWERKKPNEKRKSEVWQLNVCEEWRGCRVNKLSDAATQREVLASLLYYGQAGKAVDLLLELKSCPKLLSKIRRK